MNELFSQSIGDRFDGHAVTYYRADTSSASELIRQASGAQVLAVRRSLPFRIDAEVLAHLPTIQFIQKSGTGVDSFDVEALNEHGILLANNQGLNASDVAEHAVTLILLAMRDTHWYVQNLSDGNWRRAPSPRGVHSIRGKTVGVVGLGASGAYVAKTMQAMGARVIATQRHHRPDIEPLTGIDLVSLEELLCASDIVTLHVPLTPQTQKMIGSREFHLMKDSAILVNCSRGKVIDEGALVEALSSGHIRAAGLDVFEEEPLTADNPILKLENAILTPHIAGYSEENIRVQLNSTFENLERFVRGERPLRLVNPEVLSSDTLRADHL